MKLRRLLAVLAFTLAAPSARAEVLVFAAASLKEPIDAMAAAFGDVVVSYGGSGSMARQVGLGAPADVVLLANPAWMDVLVSAGNVDASTVADVASNRLVLIAPKGAAPVTLDADAIVTRLDGGRLALGLTQSVPAGIYAKAALENLNLWDGLTDHLAEVDNVRAALALVARGQAPMGIVYNTDLRVSDDVAEVALIPQDAHPPIRYLGAVTAQTNDPRAIDFLQFVRSAEGQMILAEAGFLPSETVTQ